MAMETKEKSGKLLYTVSEVFADNGYLQEKEKKYYNIPLYQRGYKWEPHNVNKLLNDIDNFAIGDGKFYCLQNITIVGCGEYFNVIDGQQRLTTLSIILSFLNQKVLVNRKVRFPENSICILSFIISRFGKVILLSMILTGPPGMSFSTC